MIYATPSAELGYRPILVSPNVPVLRFFAAPSGRASSFFFIYKHAFFPSTVYPFIAAKRKINSINVLPLLHFRSGHALAPGFFTVQNLFGFGSLTSRFLGSPFRSEPLWRFFLTFLSRRSPLLEPLVSSFFLFSLWVEVIATLLLWSFEPARTALYHAGLPPPPSPSFPFRPLSASILDIVKPFKEVFALLPLPLSLSGNSVLLRPFLPSRTRGLHLYLSPLFQ